MTPLEIASNFFNLLSVYFANRNNVYTWWTGIVGSILFGVLFFEAKLYADVNLQIFFIVTSVWGWWNWLYGGAQKEALPITRVGLKQLSLFALLLEETQTDYVLLTGSLDKRVEQARNILLHE